MKKLLSALLVLVMLLSFIPAAQAAQVGSCGDGVYWRFEDGVLTISGEGVMDPDSRDYKVLKDQVTKVVVQTGVTSVCRMAFYYFYNLKTVILQDGVERISQYSFEGCDSLESIEIPGSLVDIYGGAFNYCSKLTDIDYGGTEAQWAAIEKDDLGDEDSFEILAKANIHCSETPYRWLVTFDPRGGTVSPTSARVGEDFKLTSLPTPSMYGYYFNGWYDGNGVSAAKVTTDYVFKKNCKIYARWQKCSPIIRVDFTSHNSKLTPGEPFPSEKPVLAPNSHCSVYDYYWTDASDNRVSGIPKAGEDYWLNLLLKADETYTFGEAGARVSIYLNDSRLMDGTVLEDYNGEKGLLCQKLPRKGPDPVSLTRVDFTELETELTFGKEFPNKFGVTAPDSHCKNTIYYWEDPWGNVASGIPEEGRYYWLNIYIEPDAGYTFGPVGTKVPVYRNGEKLGDGEVVSAYGRDEILHLQLRRTGPAPVLETISSAVITVTTPVAGGSVIPDGVAAPDSPFTIAEQYWCTERKSSTRLSSGTFTNALTYYYYARLVPDEGYEFPGTPGNYIASYELSVKVSGKEVNERYKLYPSGEVYVFAAFTAEGDTYSGPVMLSGLSMPLGGASAAAQATTGSGAYEITKQGWYTDTTLAEQPTVFEAGTAYYYVCEIKPTGGAAFPSGWAGPMYINGDEVASISLVEFIVMALAKQELTYYSVGKGVISLTLCRIAANPDDMNGDGAVDALDAWLLFSRVSGASVSFAETAEPDVNGDGKLNNRDAIQLFRRAATAE